jgi:hypothetical protein
LAVKNVSNFGITSTTSTSQASTSSASLSLPTPSLGLSPLLACRPQHGKVVRSAYVPFKTNIISLNHFLQSRSPLGSLLYVMQWSSYLSNLSDHRQSTALEAAVDGICPKCHVFLLTTHVSSRLSYYCFIYRHHGLLQTGFCEIALQDKFLSPELSLPLPIHLHGAG